MSLRLLGFAVLLTALSGCDLFAPTEIVSGRALDATDGTPIANAHVSVGQYRCVRPYLPGVSECPEWTFETYGFDRTDSDGAFQVEYSLRDDDQARLYVGVCSPPGAPVDCPYLQTSVALPTDGDTVVEVERLAGQD